MGLHPPMVSPPPSPMHHFSCHPQHMAWPLDCPLPSPFSFLGSMGPIGGQRGFPTVIPCGRWLH